MIITLSSNVIIGMMQGAVATAGQVVDWLKNEMKFVSSIDEIGMYIQVM